MRNKKIFFQMTKGVRRVFHFKNRHNHSSQVENVGGRRRETPLLGKEFDVICETINLVQTTGKMRKVHCKVTSGVALGKAGLEAKDIRYILRRFIRQNIATSFGLMDYEITLWTIWCVFYGRRIHGVRCDVCAMRICQKCSDINFKSFCECGETVSISPGGCQSKDHYQLPGRLPEVVPLYFSTTREQGKDHRITTGKIMQITGLRIL